MSAVLAAARLQELVRVAQARNASDIHLRADAPPALRVDGELQILDVPVLDSGETAALAQTLLEPAAQERLERRGDATQSSHYGGSCSLRVHAYRTANGISVALRLLPLEIPALESLHLPAAVSAFTERPHGLVIVTGPTGSGKSTALAAMADRINRSRAAHILTIEDPIEFVHVQRRCIITQREVGRDVPTFADAVYGALRSDPDVILLGEMRDMDTMHAALTAAETGHLVFATLHTGDTPQAVDRIASAFPAAAQERVRTQIAQTLVGIAGVRLIPRACGTGRRSAAEVLVATDAVRNVIRDGKVHHLRNILATSRSAGMQTLESALSELVLRGEVGIAEARAATDRPHEIEGSENYG